MNTASKAVERLTVAYLKGLRANGVKVPDDAEVIVAATADVAKAEYWLKMADQVGESELRAEYRQRAAAAARGE